MTHDASLSCGAVVVVTAFVITFQTRTVPRAIPYGSTVHVRGVGPRVFDGQCFGSIQEWLFEAEEDLALVTKHLFVKTIELLLFHCFVPQG